MDGLYVFVVFLFFFFKQKTAYEMRISDWSSDVCSSDLFTAGFSAMAFAFAFNLLLERMRNRTPSLMDMSYEEESIPTFNRADSHPDAPPRRPIFANSDFAEMGPLAVSAAPVESSEGLRLPKTPEPLDEVDLECDAVPAPLQASADVRENIPAASSPVEDPAGIIASGTRLSNHSHFSITELVDRFERGMAHRRQLVAEAATAKKAREAAAQEQPAWLEPARVTSTSSQNPQPDRKSRSGEHTSELQSLMRISYAVYCLKKTKTTKHR